MTETATRAEFARAQGVNRSTVTRWVREGRVVMAGDRVDVAASRARLQATAGQRPDVAARHAAGRSPVDDPRSPVDDPRSPVDDRPATPQARGGAGNGPGDAERIGNSYQTARAVREKYAALRARAEYEQMLGNLLAREDVELAMRSIGAAVRAALDVLPDQAAPLVAPVSDLHQVHALLTDACRNLLHGLDDSIGRERARLAGGGQ